MKLIVSGGSGLVATEVIRQSLLTPLVTSLVVLSRRPISLTSSENTEKLKQVIVDDYEHYSENAKAQLAGADACIWYVLSGTGKSPPRETLLMPLIYQDGCHHTE